MAILRILIGTAALVALIAAAFVKDKQDRNMFLIYAAIFKLFEIQFSL